jgi:hypothetical protein
MPLVVVYLFIFKQIGGVPINLVISGMRMNMHVTINLVISGAPMNMHE